MKRLGIVCLVFAVAACGSGAEVDFARSLAVKAPADLVLRNGKIVTVDHDFSIRQSLAIRGGRFIAVGTDREIRPLVGTGTRVIDLGGRTVIPGLIDSHIYATVAGISWDNELHWESLRALGDGFQQIAADAKAKPPGTWIVVAGGWVPTQFAERRFPTREELDTFAPKHPVYVQYLREGALLNSAALATVGIHRDTLNPAGGKFERDPNTGELTGWLHGVAAWQYVYNKIPRLSLDKVRQSLKNCFHELSRLGVTSIGDLQTHEVTFAERRVVANMAGAGELPLRINFYIVPDAPGDELEQLELAAAEMKQLARNDMFRFAGFGVTSLDASALSTPSGVTLSVGAKEKFRRLATFFAESEHNFHVDAGEDSTARQLLDVLEQVNAATPLTPRRFGFAQLDDATPETIARIKKLGGGIAVQDFMALTGERNAELRGLAKTRSAPPLRRMIESGVPLGAGTGAFRGGNFSPMLSLWWLVTGKTIAGTVLRDRSQNLTRQEALRLYTIGSAWFTFDEGRKGSLEVGKLADLAVLNRDYLTVPEDQIRLLESVLTMVNGRIVYAAAPFTQAERK